MSARRCHYPDKIIEAVVYTGSEIRRFECETPTRVFVKHSIFVRFLQDFRTIFVRFSYDFEISRLKKANIYIFWFKHICRNILLVNMPRRVPKMSNEWFCLFFNFPGLIKSYEIVRKSYEIVRNHPLLELVGGKVTDEYGTPESAHRHYREIPHQHSMCREFPHS